MLVHRKNKSPEIALMFLNKNVEFPIIWDFKRNVVNHVEVLYTDADAVLMFVRRSVIKEVQATDPDIAVKFSICFAFETILDDRSVIIVLCQLLLVFHPV